MVRLDCTVFEKLATSLPKYSGTKGSIVWLRVRDFMTYHDVEMRAGPNVNLIMGPNGTGKSTIVCAILLGLAGKQTFLGRARNLKEYIRHGTYEATIEIELHGGNEPNFIIKRIITETDSGRGSSSRWYINNRKETETNVENLMKRLNIQLDNLCQFLPQDRVQDFARMDPVELLENTEKSIDSNSGLKETHDRLKSAQTDMLKLSENLEWTLKQLRGETTQSTRMENDMKRYNERKDLEKEIDKLEGRKLWLLYLKAMDEFTTVKARFDELKRQKKAEEKLIQPLKQEIELINQKLQNFQRNMSNFQTNIESSVETVKRDYSKESDRIETNIHSSLAEVTAVEKTEDDRLQLLTRKREQLRNYQREFDAMQQGNVDYNEHQLTAKIEECQRKKLEISYKRFNVEAKYKADQDEISQKNIRLQGLRTEANKMQEFRTSRMRFLEKSYPDVAQAVKYFFDPAHPERAEMFQGTLHEPLILHISVNDLAYGHIAERHIPSADLTAFYTDDKNDVKILIQEAQKHNWRVSCIHHQMDSGFTKPLSTLTEELKRRFGFEKNLIDLVEAPEYYMSYLCRAVKPQDVLIGTSKTEALTNEIMNGTQLRTYYTKKTVVYVRTSFYTNKKNATTSFLGDARIFTKSINANDIQVIQEQVDDYTRQIHELEKKTTAGKDQIKKYEANEKELDAEKRVLEERIAYKTTLTNKIEGFKRSILETESEGRNITDLRKQVQKRILAERCRQLTHIKRCAKELCAVPDQWLENLVYAKRTTLLKRDLGKKQEALENSRAAFSELSAAVTAEDNNLTLAAEESKRLKIEAVAKTQVQEPPQDIFENRIERTAIESEINKLKARLNFLPEPDLAIVTEYRERQKKIADLELKKVSIERALNEKKLDMQTYKESWLSPLEELLEKINANFGNFFRQMNCVGEVTLDRGEDETNFAKYGIKIKVKFRANEPLVELSGWKQSGGERAITTALYILSLQELTSVPFRVIDEINQGMDAKNEARFFNLLCSLAEGQDTPQYFLLTPKMLPAVNYPDNVDFHIIFNGPHVHVDCDHSAPSSAKKKRRE